MGDLQVTLIDLDYAILGVLPEEGTKLGWTVIAKQAKGIVADLNERLPASAAPEARVRSSQINGRLRVLRLGGYVVGRTVQPVGHGQGWQRTPKGKRLLAEYEAAESGTTIDSITDEAPQAREEARR